VAALKGRGFRLPDRLYWERGDVVGVGLERGADAASRPPVPLTMLFYKGPGFLKVLAPRPILRAWPDD
jgi:hypothetical protein